METALIIRDEYTEIETKRALYSATRKGRNCIVCLGVTSKSDRLDIEFECDPLQFHKEALGIVTCWEAMTFVETHYHAQDFCDLAKVIKPEKETIYNAFNSGGMYHMLSVVAKNGTVV